MQHKLTVLLTILVLLSLALSPAGSAQAQGETPPSHQRLTTGLTPFSMQEKAVDANDKLTNLVTDPSFESAHPNPYWIENDNLFGTPLCVGESDCGYWTNAHPRSGSGWAWFGGGGSGAYHTASLAQNVIFPACGSATLQFYFWIGYSFGGGTDDQFFVKVDGSTRFSANATQMGSYSSYKLVSLNVGQFADGKAHTIEFSHINQYNDVGFHLDDVSLLSSPCVTISGHAGEPGVTLSYINGTPRSVVSQANGTYAINVPTGWSGTVTPSKTNYTFSPASRSYSNVQTNQPNQNYGAFLQVLTISGNAGVAGATLSYINGTPRSVISQANGTYSINVPRGWSGTVTPSKANYAFSPASRTYSNVVVHQPGQNYTATLQTLTISGNAGVAGAILSYPGGATASDGSGNYSITVLRGWSGTVTPSLNGYIFQPTKRTYSNVTANQVGQNYIAIRVYSISGNVGVSGVTLSYIDGTPKTVTSQPDGSYSLIVPSGWNGTVTPSHACFTFDPASRDYSNVSGDQTAQDYTPTFVPASGCANVNVDIGAALQGRFGLLPGASTRASFGGLDGGPVKLESTNAVPLIGAERLIYKVGNVPTSFTEMMGLPDSQLDTTYWLPWYNNLGLDTQLRFANVSNSTASVHVYIGGDEMDGSPFTLQPGESLKKSFPGIDDGPVQIVSDQNIVAAARLIYKVNGANTSFSEIMALPASQLDNTYWLPWYNNTGLDTQLRFANVTDQIASVHIYIGGEEMTGSPFTLQPGESTRKSFAGIDDGPVKIESDQDIVAAERLIYKANGLPTSFTEMMALPDKSLDSTYWLPWYNNTGLDTQLRFANVTDQTASVHVYIGGDEMIGSPFTLPVDGSMRISFEGIDDGPVQIVSDQNIVVAERLIYKVGNVPASFSEMMALPNSQLDTTYWFPWYNNIGLDTQLRFGVP